MKRRLLAMLCALTILVMNCGAPLTALAEGVEAPVQTVSEEPAKASADETPAKSNADEAPAKAEEPPAKAEEPPATANEPAQEEPAKEAPAPATEIPATEAPTTEAPATEAPVEEVPATEAPSEESPAEEASSTEEAPATEAPAEETPATEAPVEELPTEEPTEQPTEEPTATPKAEAPAEVADGLAVVTRESGIYASKHDAEPFVVLKANSVVYAWRSDDARWQVATYYNDNGAAGWVDASALVFMTAEGAQAFLDASGLPVHSVGGVRVPDMTAFATVAAPEATAEPEPTEEPAPAEIYVRFAVSEGAHVFVDGEDVSNGQALVIEGGVTFEVAADEGYEIVGVMAEGVPSEQLAGQDGAYALTGVEAEGVTVFVAASPLPEATEAPKTSFHYEDSRVVVEATAGEEANLPQNAELRADRIAPGSAAYAEAEAAVRQAYGVADDVEIAIAPYDIYFLCDGERIEPAEGSVSVSISFKQTVQPAIEADSVEVGDTGVVHITDGGSVERLSGSVVANGEGGIEAANFTSDSFSTFVPFALLGAPNGPESSSGLDNFTLQLEVSPADQYTKNGDTYVLQAGVTYTVAVSYGEKQTLQFENDNEMTMQIPTQFNAAGCQGTFSVTTDTGAVVEGNTYSVDGSNVIHINWNKQSPGYPDLIASGGASFRVELEGDFSGGAGELDFGNNVKLKVDIDNSTDLTVNKSAGNKVYDAATNTYTVDYTVTVKSKGVNTNVPVADVMSGAALKYKSGSLKASVNGQPVTLSGVSETANGFSATVPEIGHNQTLTINYQGVVDAGDLSVNANGGLGTDGDTANSFTAKVPGAATPDRTSTSKLGEMVGKPNMNKWGNQDQQNTTKDTATVNWTLTGTAQAKPQNNNDTSLTLAGKTVTDTMQENAKHPMKYAGTGFHVEVKDSTGKTNTADVDWTDPSASSFSYTFPASLLEGLNGQVTYTITYATEVEMKGASTTFNVGNTGTGEGLGTAGGNVGVTPGENNRLTVKKSVSSADKEGATWTITIHVPEQGVSGATLTDVLPKFEPFWKDGQNFDPGWKDELVSITVSDKNLAENESYATGTDANGDPTVTFSYTDETGAHEGFAATGTARNIAITVKTKNDAKWVEYGTTDSGHASHKNTAKVATGETTIQAEAKFTPPRDVSISKTLVNGYPQQQNGKYWFKYQVDITGVMGDITLSDSFDSRMHYLAPVNGNPWDAAKLYGLDQYNNQQGSANLTVKEKTGSVTFSAPDSIIPKDGGAYYEKYRIVYYLELDTDGKSLNDYAATQPGLKLDLTNTATFEGKSDSANYKVEYKGVDKKLTNEGQISGRQNIANFEIDINPSAVDLNPNGDFLTLKDVMSDNLAIKYDTITVLPEEAAPDVKYDYRGQTGTFIIPDATALTIKYSAMVTGNGSQSFGNTATLLGQDSYVHSTANVRSSAIGEAPNYSITVFKYDGSDMTTPVKGAQFALYDEKGTEVLRTDATGEDGKITFKGNMAVDGWNIWPNESLRDDNNVVIQENAIIHEYSIVELQPAEGYREDSTVYRFSLSSDNTKR